MANVERIVIFVNEFNMIDGELSTVDRGSLLVCYDRRGASFSIAPRDLRDIIRAKNLKHRPSEEAGTLSEYAKLRQKYVESILADLDKLHKSQPKEANYVKEVGE